jgi:hypothetical protein
MRPNPLEKKESIAEKFADIADTLESDTGQGTSPGFPRSWNKAEVVWRNGAERVVKTGILVCNSVSGKLYLIIDNPKWEVVTQTLGRWLDYV